MNYCDSKKRLFYIINYFNENFLICKNVLLYNIINFIKQIYGVNAYISFSLGYLQTKRFKFSWVFLHAQYALILTKCGSLLSRVHQLQYVLCLVEKVSKYYWVLVIQQGQFLFASYFSYPCSQFIRIVFGRTWCCRFGVCSIPSWRS